MEWNARRASEVVRDGGLGAVARRGFAKLGGTMRAQFTARYLRLKNGRRRFLFRGRSFPYVYHAYNTTYANERAVEIPIALAALHARRGERVLEVGNVLSYYARVQHRIVDKYEVMTGVENLDVVDIHGGPYDLIVTVSTLEHVGWDETPQDPPKVLRAVEHLRSLLAPDGTLLVTVPMGQNTFLDAWLRDHGASLAESLVTLERLSDENEWREIPPTDAFARDPAYHRKWPGASLLAVVEFRDAGGKPS